MHQRYYNPSLGAIKVGGQVEIGGAEGKAGAGLLGAAAGAGVVYWGIKKLTAENVTKKQRSEGLLVVGLGLLLGYFAGIKNLT